MINLFQVFPNILQKFEWYSFFFRSLQFPLYDTDVSSFTILCTKYVCNCGKNEYDWIEKLLHLNV